MAVRATGDDGALIFDSAIDVTGFDAGAAHIEQRTKQMLENIQRIYQQAGQQQNQVFNSVANSSQKAKEEALSLQDVVSKATTAIAAYFSFRGAENLIGQIVKTRGEFEQLEVTFRVLLQSKEKADRLLAEATQLAATTPFSLKDVATGAKQLLAYGFSADSVIQNLKTLGNIAAATGQPLGDLVYLYGTLQTQGRAYTRDILQFTSRGIPVIAELAKQFGVSKEQVAQLVESGQVGFPQIEKAFQSMTGAGGQFFNLMQEQSKTVTGQISNLGDAFDVMLNNIGKSNEGIITGSIGALKTLVDNYQKVIDILETLVLTYGVYKAAIIAQTAYTATAAAATQFFGVAVKELTISETLYGASTLIAEKATALLNRTMLANPYVAVATLIAALAFTLYRLRDSTNAAEQATAELTQEEAKATEQRENLKNKTQELVAIIQSETSTRFAQLEAFQKLQQMYPGYLGKLDLQAFKTISAKDAQLEFNKALEAAELQRKEQEYDALIKKIQELEGALSQSKGQGLLGDLIGSAKYQSDLDVAKEKAKLLGKEIENDKQAQFESNTSAADLKVYYENALNSLRKQRGELERNVDLSKKAGLAIDGWRNSLAQISLDRINKQIDDFIAKLKGLTGQNTGNKTNKQLIDEANSLDQLKTVRTKIDDDYNKEVDASRRAQLAKDLEYADKRKKILDVYGDDKKDAKQRESIESKINEILNQRGNILDKLAGLQRDSKQSGLLQDQSEIDKIREKYDEAFKAIEDYNTKVATFNKKNGTNVQGIGLADVNKLRNAEAVEIANTSYKQDSAAYIAALDDKKKAFEDFQRIQQTGNEEQVQFAKDSYRSQVGDFTSYLEYLKSEADNLKFFIKIQPDNIGLQQSLVAVNKQIVEEGNKQAAATIQQRNADYASALQTAMTFADKKKQIDDKYNKDALALASNANDKNLHERLQALKQAHDQETTDLNNQLLRQSELYQQLNEDIIGFTRQRLKKQIDLLKQELKQGFVIDPVTKQKTVLTPQMKADLQNAIQGYENLYALSDKLTENLDDVIKLADEGAAAFKNIAAAVQDTNAGLADTLNTTGDLISIIGNLALGTKQLIVGFEAVKRGVDATGQAMHALDYASVVLGIISTVVKVVTAVVGFFSQAKKTARESAAELKTYQESLIKGEVTYNELLRQRARDQKNINDLTVQELMTREKLLDTQKQQAQADYDKLLKQIQDTGNQVTGEHTEKYGGVIGIGRKTKVVQDLSGLSGADYDQLEKLFTEGKLDKDTAAWFSELQKVHDELGDIGESAQEVEDQLNQALTGTTADSIVDSIISGFKDGKRAAADFADDFQSLMQNAILQSLKYNALQQPLQDFYKQFAADASSDGALTDSEITTLQNTYNGIIDNARKQFEDLQNITKVNFDSSSGSSSSNSLQGAVKNITEESAQLLAGQTGAIRLNQAQMINLATQHLQQLNMIATYTSDIPNMMAMMRKWDSNGLKVN